MSSLRTEDELALLRLAHRYAIANDRRDSDGYVAVFTPDAQLTVRVAGGGLEPHATFRGHEELATIPQKLARFERTFHLVGTYLYDSDGDGAVGVVYCAAHHLTADHERAVDFVQHIRYDDRYRRDPSGRWAIDRRDVTVEWSDLLDVGPPFLPTQTGSGESGPRDT